MKWLCFLCCSELGMTLTRSMPTGHCFCVIMTLIMNNILLIPAWAIPLVMGDGLCWPDTPAGCKHSFPILRSVAHSWSSAEPLPRNCCLPRSHRTQDSYPSLGTVEIPLFFQRGGKGPGTLPSFTGFCGALALLWGLLTETSAAWVQHLPQPISASSFPPIYYSWEPTPQISI